MQKGRLNREVWGVVISLTALLTIISLFSYDFRDRSFNTPSGTVNTGNWGGFIGAFLADLLLQGLGLSSYLIPVFLGLAAARLFRGDNDALAPRRIAGGGLLLISMAVILSLLIDSESARDGGGIVGGHWEDSILVPLFGRLSAALIAVVILLLSLMLATQNSLLDILAQTGKKFGELKKSWLPAVYARLERFRQQRKKQKGE